MGQPFAGDILPGRVALFRRGRPALPFPHLGNYRRPLDILETMFWEADQETGAARHNRYLTAPLAPLGLVTRDPAVIKAILLATGDKPGQFDRDQWPTRGIARTTGADSILYANGPRWRGQKKLAAPGMAQPVLFNAERFHEFEVTFRKTIVKRLEALHALQVETGKEAVEVQLEAEVSAVMMEMLVNNFFGASVAYEEIRTRYIPSIQALIRYMVRDTLGFRFLMVLTASSGAPAEVQRWRDDFEELTDLALAGRRGKRAAWAEFDSDLPDDALRPNIRVFLAGAVEATTSMATWALAHLARRPDVQDRIFEETKALDTYNPENLAQAKTLRQVMEETLRLSPALYFLPRVATAETWITTDDGRRMMIPKKTHVLLDVWHANRCEEFWGVAATGFPADRFEPARWDHLQAGDARSDLLHFGFGHGARVCPGKFLGQLEVGLVVGAFVKVFRFTAVDDRLDAVAGVSTKPAGGTLVRLARR